MRERREGPGHRCDLNTETLRTHIGKKRAIRADTDNLVPASPQFSHERKQKVP
ncbi:hypothetical protein AA0472_2257 [Acetobacter estunensis NRIC 0472]|nr:hypothetical protein AA0472_2257 [Acetobacter estunensis NRIC 0472]